MVQTHKAFATAAEKNATSNGSEAVSRGVSEELTALRAMVEAASHGSGEEYFQAFVRNLAHPVGARYAFVAEFASAEINTKARAIAFLGTIPDCQQLRVDTRENVGRREGRLVCRQPLGGWLRCYYRRAA
jgi:hypothetical protein